LGGENELLNEQVRITLLGSKSSNQEVRTHDLSIPGQKLLLHRLSIYQLVGTSTETPYRSGLQEPLASQCRSSFSNSGCFRQLPDWPGGGLRLGKESKVDLDQGWARAASGWRWLLFLAAKNQDVVIGCQVQVDISSSVDEVYSRFGQALTGGTRYVSSDQEESGSMFPLQGMLLSDQCMSQGSIQEGPFHLQGDLVCSPRCS
jgi:hypothetical protein